jgi:hypothetical protein
MLEQFHEELAGLSERMVEMTRLVGGAPGLVSRDRRANPDDPRARHRRVRSPLTLTRP